MRIGVDLDGVVIDWFADWSQHYLRDFGIKAENVVDSWAAFWRGTHFKNESEFWRWLSNTPTWSQPIPYPGALHALRAMQDDGHKLIVLTSKPRWAVARTLRWLDSLYYVRGLKWFGAHVGSFPKHAIPAEAYVDDAPHNLERYAEHRADAHIFRMVRPWNTHIAGTIPVHDLHDLRDELQIISKGDTQ